MEIDLDAIKKAREGGRKRSDRHHVRFRGKRFPIAEETPWDLAFGIATNDVNLIIEGLKDALGKNWETFRELKPSIDDVVALALAIKALDDASGESTASRGSSSNGSRRSRRTSNGSIT